MNIKSDSTTSVPSNRYTIDYFLAHSDGHKEFQSTKGHELPPRLKAALEMAEIRPGMVILDIGCGRGEILYHAYQKGAIGWGMDFSKSAIEIITKTYNDLIFHQPRNRIYLQRANATDLPYGGEHFDVVFLLDIVEHLNPQELEKTLRGISRVLKKNGTLILHTMPNLWYYRFGYPLYRAFQFLRGIKLPKDPRDRWEYKDVHVNEQTPRSLAITLKQYGYEGKITVTSVVNYPDESNQMVKKVMIFISRAPILRWIFGNDIFAIVKRQSK